MTPRIILRICVIVEWVFVAAAVVLSMLLEGFLPPQLQEWLAAESEDSLTFSALIVFALLVIVLVSSLVASFGLFFLKRWAAWLYLASTVGAYLVLPFTGPCVDHAVSRTIEEISVLLSGMILALAFFSDALKS